jgi:hypothetical protein
MSPIAHIIEDSAIPIIVGVYLLVWYRSNPERFSSRWTPIYVTFVAAVLIVGSVLLAIWNTYERAR